MNVSHEGTEHIVLDEGYKMIAGEWKDNSHCGWCCRMILARR
jgi:hypothetical protein